MNVITGGETRGLSGQDHERSIQHGELGMANKRDIARKNGFARQVWRECRALHLGSERKRTVNESA